MRLTIKLKLEFDSLITYFRFLPDLLKSPKNKIDKKIRRRKTILEDLIN